VIAAKKEKSNDFSFFAAILFFIMALLKFIVDFVTILMIGAEGARLLQE
jgi:hypothetical protein